MLEEQVVQRGITDVRTIEAMNNVLRHKFVPFQQEEMAYNDSPVSIGEGQTISQPFMVALMTQSLALRGHEKVLEIGTGSGYQTAILAELCQEVYTIERIAVLAQRARNLLRQCGYRNVHSHIGDGTLGWPEDVVFDAIVVTAGSPDRLAPLQSIADGKLQQKTVGGVLDHLLKQLKDQGRMIIPVGSRAHQVLTCIIRQGEQTSIQEICPCVFVPLVGRYGWKL